MSDVLSAGSAANKWHRTILNGLTEVERYGVPGTIVVFDTDRSQPILTGEYQTDVVIAGATYGKGKLIAFAHDTYSLGFKGNNSLLYQNIQKWLVGEPVNPDQIRDISQQDPLNPEDLASFKIFVWSEDSFADKSEAFMTGVQNFMAEGGGVVIGATPWGHLQLHPTKDTVEDLSTHKFLLRFGLGYTTLYCRGSGNFLVSKNKAEMASAGDMAEVAISEAFDHSESDTANLLDDIIDRCYPWFPDEKQRDIWNKCQGLVGDCQPINQSDWPVNSAGVKVWMCLYERCGHSDRTKMPGIEWFPGDFKKSPQMCSVSITVESDKFDYHPTGYYAPAGQKVAIFVIETSTLASNWSIMIGAHTDGLSGEKVLKRWPNISCRHRFPISREPLEISSPYGGLIYLVSPSKLSQVHIELHDVVEAPYFNLRDPENVEEWHRRRLAPGLWADLSGEFITFTVPSSYIRDLEDPVSVIKLWDSVVREHHHLKGTNVWDAQKQWVVFDVQPVVGYMHSGYPIVAQLDYALDATFEDMRDFALNFDAQCCSGNWGLYHEIGHNMQEDAWTFNGTGEVTCNIFTLHAMEKIPHICCWTHPWLGDMACAREYLNGVPMDYQKWRNDPQLGLIIYVQLAHHFGWGAYKKVFRLYASCDNPVKTDQEKIDQWLIDFSEAVGVNLAPLFDFWGIPFSTHVHDRLKSLPPFLPDDKVTQMAAGRAIEICSKYGNVERIGKVLDDDFEDEIDEQLHSYPHIKTLLLQKQSDA